MFVFDEVIYDKQHLLPFFRLVIGATSLLCEYLINVIFYPVDVVQGS